MNSFQTFFQIPIVKFVIHLILVIGAFVNIYNIYNLYQVQIRLQQEQQTLANLIQQNNNLRNQKDYFNSDLYKEKYAKEQNFRKRGEEVIDTLETFDSSQPNFVPEKPAVKYSQIEKWWYCFFGIPKNMDNGSATQGSFCRDLP